MDKRSEIRELIKLLIIVCLFISALVMGASNGILAQMLRPEVKIETAAATPMKTAGAAEMPSVISVLFNSGTRKSEKYDSAGLERMYSVTSSALCEAVATANNAQSITEEEWRTALTSPGVYFEYSAPAGFDIIAGWLGANNTEIPASEVSRLCHTGNAVFAACTDGSYIRLDTVFSESVSDSEIDIGESGSVFAFEVGSLGGIAGDMLIFTERTEYSSFSVQNPMSIKTNRDLLMLQLGAAESAKNLYTAEDGTETYVASDFTLRISTDGTAVYKLTGKTAGEEFSESEAIEAARSMCSVCLLPFCGDSMIQYAGWEKTDGGTTVYFDYAADGGTVGDGMHAAEIIVSEGSVSAMILRFEQFKRLEETVSLLPETLTAAAGGRFRLQYVSSGDTLLPAWVSED